MTTTKIEYTHLPAGEDKHAGDGISASWQERKTHYAGREVFYLMTEATVDTVCCGDRVFHYATVLGYVSRWQEKMNEAGLPISEMEPITDPGAQKDIEDILHQQYPGAQVDFRQD